MFRLLAFLSANRNFFLLVSLEVIALVLVIRFNDHQRHAWGDSVLEVSSKMQQYRTSISDYFTLKARNQTLNQRIVVLESDLREAQNRLRVYQGLQDRDTLMKEMADSLRSFEAFSLLPCRAIKNTTHKRYNYMTLDKGRVHGVKEGMGVVSLNGIAGRVIVVSEHYSLALSALNVSFKLSAQAKGIGNAGLYEWGTEEAGKGYLNFIPQNANLREGMEVVTSGNNTIFPQGYSIGTITRIIEAGQEGTTKAELELATNFNNLGNLFLIPAIHKAEIDSLEQDIVQPL